jgi:hypothetical protein
MMRHGVTLCTVFMYVGKSKRGFATSTTEERYRSRKCEDALNWAHERRVDARNNFRSRFD